MEIYYKVCRIILVILRCLTIINFALYSLFVSEFVFNSRQHFYQATGIIVVCCILGILPVFFLFSQAQDKQRSLAAALCVSLSLTSVFEEFSVATMTDGRRQVTVLLEIGIQNIPIVGHLMSVGYVCVGSRRKAELSACRATFGAIGGVFEVINEFVRYKSPKLVSPAEIALPTHGENHMRQWMSDYSHKRINEIYIPGSHESATFSIPDSLVHSWPICQHFTIEEQLNMGIRYLDFRVITSDGEAYIAHTYRGGKFENYLKAVQTFLIENPTEIIIVRVDHNTNGGDCDQSLLASVIHNVLGDHLIKTGEFDRDTVGRAWPTIAEMTNNGRKGRVILLTPKIVAMDLSSLQAMQFSYKTSWDNYHCQYSNEWYSNYRNFLMEYPEQSKYMDQDFIVFAGELTPEKNVIVQSIAGAITRGVGQSIGSLFVKEQFYDLRDMAFACNYQLEQFLKNERFPAQRQMIVTHDFVNPEIIRLIIAKNDVL